MQHTKQPIMGMSHDHLQHASSATSEFRAEEDLMNLPPPILKKIAEEKKRYTQTRDRLLSVIAHDLRGPVGNVHNGLMYLSTNSLPDENKRIELIRELTDSSGQALELLENLLNWSKLHKGFIRIQPQELDVSEEIDKCIRLLNYSVKQKSIDLRILSEKSVKAFADKSSFDLVIRNIISNAIKFTPEKGHVTVTSMEMNNRVVISIRDDGPGMKKEYADLVLHLDPFDPTYLSDRDIGPGIGLYLCNEFSKMNSGDIWVKTKPGSGSIFHISFPTKKMSVIP